MPPERDAASTSDLAEIRDRAEFVQDFLRADSSQAGGYLDELSGDALRLLTEIERLREALRGIATLRGWAQVVREGGEERFGFRALEESEREPVARGFEHAAYLAEEALKDV